MARFITDDHHVTLSGTRANRATDDFANDWSARRRVVVVALCAVSGWAVLLTPVLIWL